MGKPSAAFFKQAIAALDLPPERITLIGDDLYSDILGAHVVGLRTILVQTGKFQPDDARQLPEGAHLATDVMAAVDQILTAS